MSEKHRYAIDYDCERCGAAAGELCTDDSGRKWQLSHPSRGGAKPKEPVELRNWCGHLDDAEPVVIAAHRLEQEARQLVRVIGINQNLETVEEIISVPAFPEESTNV